MTFKERVTQILDKLSNPITMCLDYSRNSLTPLEVFDQHQVLTNTKSRLAEIGPFLFALLWRQEILSVTAVSLKSAMLRWQIGAATADELATLRVKTKRPYLTGWDWGSPVAMVGVGCVPLLVTSLY